MESAIIDLIYNAKLPVWEQDYETEEYKKAEKEFNTKCEKLHNLLNKEQREAFDDLFLVSGRLINAAGEDRFKKGFTMGLRLGLEVFGGKRKNKK